MLAVGLQLTTASLDDLDSLSEANAAGAGEKVTTPEEGEEDEVLSVDEALQDNDDKVHPVERDDETDNNDNEAAKVDTAESDDLHATALVSCPVKTPGCTKLNQDLTKALQLCLKIIKEEEKPRKCPKFAVAQRLKCNCGATTKHLERALAQCNTALVTIMKCGRKKVREEAETFTSCQDIKSNFPDSKSGFYDIMQDDKKIKIYCNMSF